MGFQMISGVATSIQDWHSCLQLAIAGVDLLAGSLSDFRLNLSNHQCRCFHDGRRI